MFSVPLPTLACAALGYALHDSGALVSFSLAGFLIGILMVLFAWRFSRELWKRQPPPGDDVADNDIHLRND